MHETLKPKRSGWLRKTQSYETSKLVAVDRRSRPCSRAAHRGKSPRAAVNAVHVNAVHVNAKPSLVRGSRAVRCVAAWPRAAWPSGHEPRNAGRVAVWPGAQARGRVAVWPGAART